MRPHHIVQKTPGRPPIAVANLWPMTARIVQCLHGIERPSQVVCGSTTQAQCRTWAITGGGGEDQGSAPHPLRGEGRPYQRRHPSVRGGAQGQHVKYEMFTYPGTQHGFNNDTTPRYDKAAAALAWQRTMDFFKTNLRR